MDQEKTPEYHQYARHVNSALSPDCLEFYRKHSDFVPKRFPEFEKTWFRDIRDGFDGGTVVLSWLEEHIRGQIPPDSQVLEKNWLLVWNVTIKSLDLQIKNLDKNL